MPRARSWSKGWRTSIWHAGISWDEYACGAHSKRRLGATSGDSLQISAIRWAAQSNEAPIARVPSKLLACSALHQTACGRRLPSEAGGLIHHGGMRQHRLSKAVSAWHTYSDQSSKTFPISDERDRAAFLAVTGGRFITKRSIDRDNSRRHIPGQIRRQGKPPNAC